jgi:NADH-quinone oxidoreductase subunit M
MDFISTHSLSAILLLLTAAAALISLLKLDEAGARKIALGASLAVLAISLHQYFNLIDPSNTNLQLVESYKWIGNINFALGIDGLSFSMVLLNAILLPVVLLASKPIAQKGKPRLYYSLILILSVAVMAVFMAKDLFVFFLAWELELVPMYFLINIWGSKNRNYASMKFLLYTFAAGVLLLIGFFWLMTETGFQSFDMKELAVLAQSLSYNVQLPIFILFAICFIIKLPSVPFHTWLPDAHVEAPTPVSMLLAGILLKMGCYGLMRFGLEFFPLPLVKLAPVIAVLGAVNILYGAYAALIQTDLKKVIAYSSISHMGFILMGMAALNTAGYAGAAFQMFSHGLISAALFFIVGMIYERAHTREISEFGGLIKVMPQTFFLALVAIMANLGLPGLSGFVGETLVFYGAFSSNASSSLIQISAAVATLGVILTAGYMLWLNQRVFYGEMNAKWSELKDANSREIFILAFLLGLTLVYGLNPSFINMLFEPMLMNLASITDKIV